MRTKLKLLAALLLLSTINHQLSTLFAQGTGFTYQGRLSDGANPANGDFDFKLLLYDASTGLNVLAGPITNTAVVITNGLFTMPVDFGPGVFDGGDAWLHLAVRTNSNGAFTQLSPRQQVTPTPKAIFAGTASNLSGTLPAAQLSGPLPSAQLSGAYGGTLALTNAGNSFSGSGAGLSALNANQLTSGKVPLAALGNAWKINGNTGSSPTNGHFLGTTDSNPLELAVNGGRALRLEPDTTGSGAPNVIGGSSANYMDAGGVIGAFIGGGGATNFNGPAYPNRVSAYFGSIVGGYGHWIQNYANNAAIGGGLNNTVQSAAGSSVISGGEYNAIGTNAHDSFIGSGVINGIGTNSFYSVIGGGYGNSIQGGGNNAVIGGGINNTVQAGAVAAFIGSGTGNSNTFGGAFIGAGFYNRADNFDAVVAGGAFNANAGYRSAIGGGQYNTISNSAGYAVIPGGLQNLASGNSSFAAGELAQALHNGAFVWADAQGFPFSSTANNQFLIRADGGVGIGTATPGAQLDVAGPSGTAVRLTGPGGGGARLSYDFATYYPGTNAPAASILAIDDGSWSASLDLLTKAPGAETNLLQSRLHISSSGNVGLGVAGPSYQLQLSVDSAAKPSGGSWANSSDARIKKNIQPLSGALDKLTQLRGVTFQWINPEDHANQTNVQSGFIAQEVERVFPDWVTRVGAAEHDQALTPDGKIRSLSLPFGYDALVVEALKEQQAEIKARDAEIEKMKQELAAIRQVVSQLTSKKD